MWFFLATAIGTQQPRTDRSRVSQRRIPSRAEPPPSPARPEPREGPTPARPLVAHGAPEPSLP